MIIRNFLGNDRGQAIFETVLFMPLLLIGLTAVIFFARLGVLAERAETAVRYGDLISFRQGQAYSTAAVGYLLNQAVYHTSTTQLADLCLQAPTGSATATPSSTGVNADIKAALSQSQVVDPSAPTAQGTQKFFLADGITQPSCTPGTVNINGNTPQNASNYKYPANALPMNVDAFSITAQVGLNKLLAPYLMGNGCTLNSGSACSSTTADMAFLNVAAPTQLITCVPNLELVLQIMNPVASNNLPCT